MDTTDAEKETTKSEDSLTAPSNLKAEIGSGIYGGDVNLSWDSVSVASKYNIYRSVNDDKYFQFLEYTYFTSSYDTNVEAGKAYYYKLTSVNLDPGTGVITFTIEATIKNNGLRKPLPERSAQ